MVPKVHAKGASFKGAAAYLLHDKGRSTSADRIAWIETVNLATRNPETAWRVMAATAMDALRLKEHAGVKKTGRSSRDAVLHVSLSWSPDQAPDRPEMTAFAKRALAALKAEDRQAIIVCHDDERHAHVHLLVNRVSPADGRMLSSSNERNALSALALAYEQESGKILCKQRQENADRRGRGEYVRGEKEVPRPEFEALREAQEAAEADQFPDLAKEPPEVAIALRKESLAVFREKLAELRQRLRPHWAGLYARQRGERQASAGNEGSIRARVAAWIAGQAAQGASLPFMRNSTRDLAGFTKAQASRHERDRATLARSKRHEVAALIAERSQSYAGLLGRLRGIYDAAARLRPSSQESGAFTPEQRRAMELNRTAARPSTGRGTPGRDREFEP